MRQMASLPQKYNSPKNKKKFGEKNNWKKNTQVPNHKYSGVHWIKTWKQNSKMFCYYTQVDYLLIKFSLLSLDFFRDTKWKSDHFYSENSVWKPITGIMFHSLHNKHYVGILHQMTMKYIYSMFEVRMWHNGWKVESIVSKSRPRGHIWPATSFHVAWEGESCCAATI